MLKLIRLVDGNPPEDGLPAYVIDDGKVRRTVHHPLGWTDLPDYELKGDGGIYRTENHPLGAGTGPDYEFRGNGCLYRTRSHPGGESAFPEFAVAD